MKFAKALSRHGFVHDFNMAAANQPEVDDAQSAHWEDKDGDEHHRGSRMSLRKRTDGNRFSRSLGLARSFRCESARAWRCVRDLRGKLAKSLPDNGRQYEDHTLRRSDSWDGARL